MKKQKSKESKKSKQQLSLPKPGNESIRSNREDMNNMFVEYYLIMCLNSIVLLFKIIILRLDRHHEVIAKWCFALNYCSSITVWEYTFHPREYLFQQLDARFNK